jgi:hypothetical protein
VEAVLLELLHRLEAIEDAHPELGDSDVREAMSRAVFAGFIRSQPGYNLPDSFEMYTPEGDRKVREVIEWFLAEARSAATSAGLSTFHQRLAAFQNKGVRTARTNDTEDYFGWAPPDQYDEVGKLLPPIRQAEPGAPADGPSSSS